MHIQFLMTPKDKITLDYTFFIYHHICQQSPDHCRYITNFQ